MFQKTHARIVAAAVALAGSSLAMADGTFAVPTAITDAGADVLLVGAAVLTIAVGVKLYKWIKSAL